jgi:integrase
MPRPSTGMVIVRKTKGGRSYSIRFTAYGKRHQLRLGTSEDGWTRAKAEEELENVKAAVRLGVWTPPKRQAVEAPTDVPTFHVFASEWVELHRHDVKDATVAYWRDLLEVHLLPFFADHALDTITVGIVDQYRVTKLREREQWNALTDEERHVARKRHVARPGLGPTRINKTIELLARILDQAIEYGHVKTTNPARGTERRVKIRTKPPRSQLDLHEARAVLAAAGDERALIGVMMLAGLRISEALHLTWANVDLAAGVLHVEESKTDAGKRKVEVSPDLREALVLHRAESDYTKPGDLVFCTSRGTAYLPGNVRRRTLAKVVERANELLVEAGHQPIAERITPHSLRRTFASLLYEAGETPKYVMSQMGHTSSDLALEIYAKTMNRSRDAGERMDALLRGDEKAQKGANGASAVAPFTSEETEVAA